MSAFVILSMPYLLAEITTGECSPAIGNMLTLPLVGIGTKVDVMIPIVYAFILRRNSRKE